MKGPTWKGAAGQLFVGRCRNELELRRVVGSRL